MGIYDTANVPDDAKRFAREQGIRTYQKGDELIFDECPYCHGREKDNRKKFSINMITGQFQCFRASCGVTGNMVTLSKDFNFSLGREVDEYYRPSKQFWKPRQPKEPVKPKDSAVEYLENRGIPEEITQKYEISTLKDNDRILMFPFYDDKGVLEFIKIRDMDFQKGVSEWKEKAFHKDMKPILFGMKQCEGFGRIVVTEGQLDSLSVATAGIANAVSVPMGVQGWTWVPYCWDWMQKFQQIVVFGDYEKGHITLLDELESRFRGKVKHVREEDYKGCKDANELLQKYGIEAVRQAVENAVSPPVQKVLDLAEVESVNVYELEKLKTGISELDNLLYGGLPFGGVTLIGGKRGDGKSTLASQILVNAVDQGYTVMAYSGELPNYQFKSWFDFQAAGRSKIIENQGKFGGVNRFITNSNQELINEWYRGKAFIYDSRIAGDDETESILDTVRNAIMQYGVRVVLIDNLMTAMYDEPTEELNKYDRQGRFVQQLTKIALEFNVLILLVAHMRKNGSGDTNDDVSGSGDITNLASITITYNRNKDLPDYQRKLIVAKNRLFGKTDFDGIILGYDEKSKRIYGKGDDLNRHFGWESQEFTTEEDEDNPFDDYQLEFEWEDDDDTE